jgi:hypothetical protein
MQVARNAPVFWTIRAIKNVVIEDILAIEPDARAKNGIGISLGIPGNAQLGRKIQINSSYRKRTREAC